MNKRFYFFMMFVVTFILVFYYVFYTNHTDTKMVVNYNGNNLRISIDGVESTTLPTSGNYYLVDYTCKSASTTVSWDRTTYQLKVSNQNKEGGVSCYLDFQSSPKLADMPVGSYVAYTGNNGCSGESCNGQNANYVSDAEMGYCNSSNYKFIVNGWRIGYTKNKTAYLVSAGATDCMCTDSTGTASSSSCSDYLSASDLDKHFDNMNALALKYCNQDFSYGGVCDETTAWAMKADDFQNIVSKALSSSSCYIKYSDRTCGYTNDLIDNGGYYWFATVYSSSTARTFIWYPDNRIVNYDFSRNVDGVRPVLHLESGVQVAGGSGTYEDPYQIINNSFVIQGGAKYVNASEKSSVVLTLVSSEASQMCISVGTSGCSNYIDFATSYILDWSSATDGEKIVYVYYKNSDGEVIASMSRSIILDTVAPSNNSVTIGDAAGLTRTLTISSTGAETMCFSNTSSSVNDCTDWVTYATSKTWRLSDGTGSKTVYAFFKDEVGNISSTTATVEVTSIVEFVVNEDFADTTYDSNITVTDGDTYPWTVSSGQFQSSNQGQNSTTSSSTIQFTPTLDATLSFDYGVSSEASYDKLTITLSGSDSSSSTLVSAISGTNSGSITDIALTSGVTYTLTLSYVKDSSSASGSDIGYIDNLVIQS